MRAPVEKRSAYTLGKGDRAQQGQEREEEGRSGSKSGMGSGGERGRKGHERRVPNE